MKKTVEEIRIETDKLIGKLNTVSQQLKSAQDWETIHLCIQILKPLAKGKIQLEMAVKDFELDDCTRSHLIDVIEQTCKRLSKRCYNLR